MQEVPNETRVNSEVSSQSVQSYNSSKKKNVKTGVEKIADAISELSRSRQIAEKMKEQTNHNIKKEERKRGMHSNMQHVLQGIQETNKIKREDMQITNLEKILDVIDRLLLGNIDVERQARLQSKRNKILTQLEEIL